MRPFNADTIVQMLYMLFPIVLSLSVHEFSHALAAESLGDHTAKMYGRLTLDPLKHLDPIGFIALFLFGFGWANPVPFNPDNLKNRKLGTVIISIAGPLSNLLLAAVFSVLLKKVCPMISNDIITAVCYYGVTINISLMAFNLLPLPPLDGSRIITAILPYDMEMWVYEHQQFISLAVIIMIVTGGVGTIMYPIMAPFLKILL